MHEYGFVSPQTIDEVCQRLTEPGSRLIAGGTDVIPQMRDGRFKADQLIDLSRLDSLNYIEWQNGTISIGALTTYTAMKYSELLRSRAALLATVAGLVGGVQTQNLGTIGGNIANASPAGDTLPPLLTLDATVTLVSTEGERTLPLSAFLQGPGKTALAPHEIIRQIDFAPLPEDTGSLFLRLGNRRGMVISVASLALILRLSDDQTVEEVRIALGAVAPTAIRCEKTEALLSGTRLTDELIAEAAEMAVGECSPIDDVRGSAEYRRYGVKTLLRRGLLTLAGRR